MQNIYVGRQPIYNRQLKVIGYELLFRRFDCETSGVFDHDTATSQVILNTFLEIGLDELVGAGLAFINLTRSFIIEKYPLPLSENRVVLEVLENIEIDNELVDAVQDLSNRGYTIALDDVVNPADVAKLLPYANIVKVDLMGMDLANLESHVRYLKQYTNIRLLAEKVETHEVFELCKKLGFHYYQGFFFSKPNVVTGKTIPESRLGLLRLLAKLQGAHIEFKEMEEIVEQDVSISYKLLRLINSSFYARPRKINSIRQALTLLGIKQIKDWVSLLALSKIEDKPRELMITAMVRGKMAEIIANSLKLKNADAGFTVGLFSVLDALLDMPFEDIITLLPLTTDITDALVSKTGKLGVILAGVLAYEHGEWDNVSCCGFKPENMLEAYLESIKWANAVSGLL